MYTKRTMTDEQRFVRMQQRAARASELARLDRDTLRCAARCHARVSDIRTKRDAIDTILDAELPVY